MRGHALLDGEGVERVALPLVEHAHDVFALLQEASVDSLAEGRLSYQSNSHDTPPGTGWSSLHYGRERRPGQAPAGLPTSC